MRPLLSPDQMYALERGYFDTGAPSLPLMERAAQALVEAFEARFGPLEGRRVAVACGAGNNGGDGWAFACLAAQKHARVTILAMKPVESIKGDAQTCARRAQALGLAIRDDATRIPRPDAWVDALFGIGLSRPVSEEYATVIARINGDHRSGSRVLAVDAPSGLSLLTGHPLGACVEADVTVTFEYPKRGHYLFDGLDLCGEVIVSPIGLAERPLPEEAALLVQPEDALAALPARRRNIHKGSCGHLLIVAGSLGMCGAAMYAARAALRMGTGLVTLAAPCSILPTLQTLVPGAMCLGMPEENGALSAAAAEPIRAALAGKSAVIVGPGLGKAAPEAVAAALEADLPAVVDADALNAVSRSEALRALLGPRHVLTPHPGEAARLMGPVGDDQIAAATRLWEATGAVVLLKGASTVIRGEGVHVSASGCGGMATGGSGDVLAGMVGGLLAQGVEPEAAAWAGSQLHGLAGEEAARRFTETAMTAADLIDYWPEALKRLAGPKRV